MTATELVQAALWSFGATACCALYMNARLKEVLLCGLLGAISWVLYRVCALGAGNVGTGYLAGAFAAAALSEVLAVALHKPATVFLIPGLLPLVPGGGIFTLMRAVLQEEFDLALHTAYDTLVAAVAIALGVAVSSSGARIIHSLFRKNWRSRH